MACGACGCACRGGESSSAAAAAAAAEDPWQAAVKRAGDRIAKYIVRGFLIVLWLYLFNVMKRFAINYIGEDTWFTTSVVIVVSVPMTEAFAIIGESKNYCIS
ncbi:hypothetical protein ACP4OV_015043 [Aristida adscensionis]